MKLHCDYRVGTPGACPRREGNEFYLVNGVQRPLCHEHAEKLAEHNEVFHLEMRTRINPKEKKL